MAGEMTILTDLFKLPSVTHCGDHLGQFVLMTLENSERRKGNIKMLIGNTGSEFSPVYKLPVRFAAEIVPGGYPEISSLS